MRKLVLAALFMLGACRPANGPPPPLDAGTDASICEQACANLAAGKPLEQAAPDCKDSSRLPDSSTVRRWAERRLLSVGAWLKSGAFGRSFLKVPTIVAWDLAAFCRILPIEVRSP